MAKPRTVRQDLGEAITEVFSKEWLREFANTVKDMTKGVWGDGVCPECGSPKRVKVEIPDIQGQLKAVTELLEQAEGRPGTAGAEPGGVTIVVRRTWPGADAGSRDELHDAAPAGGVSPKPG